MESESKYTLYGKIASLYWLLAVVMGCVFILLHVVLADGIDLSKASFLVKLSLIFLSSIGNALVAAGLIALLFSTVQQNELRNNVEYVVEQLINRALAPLKNELIDAGYSNYRWKSLITPADKIVGLDSFFQFTRVSYYVSEIPDVLTIIAVTDTRLISQYKKDENCIFRWMLPSEYDGIAKTSAVDVFKVNALSINGKKIQPEPLEKTETELGTILIWKYKVSAISKTNHYINNAFLVDFHMRIRRIRPIEYFQVTPTLYKITSDADFQLTVDSRIKIKRIEGVDVGIKPVSKEGYTYNGPTYLGESSEMSHQISLQYPVLANSTVGFDVFL